MPVASEEAQQLSVMSSTVRAIVPREIVPRGHGAGSTEELSVMRAAHASDTVRPHWTRTHVTRTLAQMASYVSAFLNWLKDVRKICFICSRPPPLCVRLSGVRRCTSSWSSAKMSS